MGRRAPDLRYERCLHQTFTSRQDFLGQDSLSGAGFDTIFNLWRPFPSLWPDSTISTALALRGRLWYGVSNARSAEISYALTARVVDVPRATVRALLGTDLLGPY